MTKFLVFISIFLIGLQTATQAQLLKKLIQKAEESISTKPNTNSNTNSTTSKAKDDNKSAKTDTVAPENIKAKTINGKDFIAYQNYDFIPGDQIIFEDDFSSDEKGEFPAHWNLAAGQGTVNLFENKNAFLLTSSPSKITPAIKQITYLKDSMTIEMDHYAKTGTYGFQIFFYLSDKEARDQRKESTGEIDICSSNSFYLINAKAGSDPYIKAELPDQIGGDNYRNKWHHIAISIINKRLKIYIDELRVLSIPNFNLTAKSFLIKANGTNNSPAIFSNIRVANGGGMKINDKKFTDAKIITHGITFDVNTASLKPESMGVLNMIVSIMNSNPEIKFQVQGHTDNIGSASSNLLLSEKRALAVKNQLVKMGIDEARLRIVGLGDSKPISDNNTLEGRANNRRVEFWKE